MMGLLFFAIVRGIRGDFKIAAVDIVGFTGTAMIFWHIYRSHSLKLAGPLLSLLSLFGSLAILSIGGPTERYLLYPTVVVAFFLSPPATALIMTSLTVIVASFLMLPETPVFTYAKFLLSISGCMLFAYIFARERNRQRDDLMRLSTRDGLTGAGNRRAFDERLDEVIRMQKRNPVTESMLIIDLDDFKNINDTLGHTRGDQALKIVADTITTRLRAGDGLYRYGGDEFIVLANTDIKSAMVLADELRLKVEEISTTNELPVTLSVGVTQHLPDESAEHWITRTDTALFEAKRAGRNRVHSGKAKLAAG